MKKSSIHKTAIVSEDSVLGDNIKVWHFTHIRENVKIGNNVSIGQNVYIDKNVVIGNNCKIQNNVSIYDGVTIGNNVFIGPSVVFTNDKYPNAILWNDDLKLSTNICDDVSIGANSTILPGIEIGCKTIIGAGSVVTKSFKESLVIYGNPAVEVKKR
jgi:UDP-2-acetamido-3-amino-2,3-dideoxy-glucuronate N-acetyltransferase